MWLKYLFIVNYVNDESLSNTLSGQANHESGETLHVGESHIFKMQ